MCRFLLPLLATFLLCGKGYLPFNPAFVISEKGAYLLPEPNEENRSFGFVEYKKTFHLASAKFDDTGWHTITLWHSSATEHHPIEPTDATTPPSALAANTKPSEVFLARDHSILKGSLTQSPYTAKEIYAYLATLELWRTQDTEQKRLFRPFVFYDIVGFTESYFQKFDVPIQQNILNRNLKIPSILRNAQRLGKIDNFKHYTIKDLRDKANTQLTSTPFQGNGRFTIINGFAIAAEKGWAEAYQKTDIRYTMNQPENKDAVFQIASRFNCLEGSVGSTSGTLEDMQYTPVQGEEACLASMGDAIVRKYLLWSTDAAAAEQSPLNLLKDLEAAQKLTQNIFSGSITSIDSLDSNDIAKMAIGYDSAVQPTSGFHQPYVKRLSTEFNTQGATEDHTRADFLYKNDWVYQNREPLNIWNSASDTFYQKVDQVFCSAVDVKANASPAFENAAKLFLKAAYEGTILSAFINDRHTVYLTLMGAGAFRNNLDWLAAALNNELIAEVIAHTGMDVYIIIFADPRLPETIRKEYTDFIQKLNDGIITKIRSQNSKERNRDLMPALYQQLKELL